MSETRVLWDFVGCPIPESLTSDDIWDYVREALENPGYYNISMSAYVNLFDKENTFASCYIPVVHGETEDERRKKILVDLFVDVAHTSREINLMIIMNDISQHSRFIDGIRHLQLASGCNILLAQRNMPSEEVLKIVSKVWLWDSLSTGGYPIGYTGSDSDYDSDY